MVLGNIAPPALLLHSFLLCSVLWTLSSERISDVDLAEADFCARMFLDYAHCFHDLAIYTLNTHGLAHMVKCVRRLGPLWIYAMWGVERANGFLRHSIRGHHGLAKQVRLGRTRTYAYVRCNYCRAVHVPV